MNSTTKIIIALIVGLILGYIAGAATGDKSSEEVMHNDEEMMEETMMEGEDAMMEDESGDVLGETAAPAPEVTMTVTGADVAVANQSAGMQVSVAGVSLPQNSWVVVNEDRNGGLGNVLGAQWLPAGTHSVVMVDLLRGTEAGMVYYVTLRADGGDDHVFDKEVDNLLTDEAGELIVRTFRAE